jgi:sec-independent protein translocase protein TatB
MLDIGAGEILGLGVVALLLLGPKRLPTFASDAAKFLHKVKGFTSNATAELRENLGPGFENLDIADLNPKTFLKKQVSDLLDEEKPKPKVNRPVAMIDPDLL